jgi:hypothetical protein
MKKVIFISGLSLVFLASCSKDYTCKCTVTDSSGTLPTSSSSSTITGKKKEVTTACDNGDATSGTITYNCEIQ